MHRIEQTIACFKQGYSCSQSILWVYGTGLGLNKELALKIGGPFGGGMGRMGETCGAVTGAFIVIGLKSIDRNKKERDKTYQLVREFARRFKLRNKSIMCKKLLGCDIHTPHGISLAQKKGLFITLCPKFVQDAAEIIEEILFSNSKD